MRFCTFAHSNDWYIARFDCGFMKVEIELSKTAYIEYTRMFLYFAHQVFSNMYIFSLYVIWLV